MEPFEIFEYEFICDDGSKIFLEHVDAGHDDCPDGSDEIIPEEDEIMSSVNGAKGREKIAIALAYFIIPILMIAFSLKIDKRKKETALPLNKRYPWPFNLEEEYDKCISEHSELKAAGHKIYSDINKIKNRIRRYDNFEQKLTDTIAEFNTTNNASL